MVGCEADNLHLVMDGHAAGCILLEDFCHPIGEPLILQLRLVLAVLLLVWKMHLEKNKSLCNGINHKTSRGLIHAEQELPTFHWGPRNGPHFKYQSV